jgi:glycosyltransferase involved in cell wall biosynthesis
VHATSIALLTGGSDKPYALGIASALASRGVAIDFIGSDELNCPEVHAIPQLRFLNLRGDQREDVGWRQKVSRILVYYARLIRYAVSARPSVFHILWNNKFELFDRTILMAFYRLTGKQVVLTAHNVNTAARNRNDSWLNRLSLRTQYRLCQHIFVHTDAMKRQLVAEFGVAPARVTVIPFGINDTIPKSGMTALDARRHLGIGSGERTLLFFGQIAPYKGLEYLIEAMSILASAGKSIRLVIAGKVKRGSEGYWNSVERSISEFGLERSVMQAIRFIPDDQVEPYFAAADALVIPYVDIFQSGVPFLAFSFGLPVIATDVGSLREDVTRETGLLCPPKDPAALARTITEFYGARSHWASAGTRAHIRRFAEEHHSWETVSGLTTAVYDGLAPAHGRRGMSASKAPSKCPE